jgi:predicted negative regulator of RcsB-dependent stress response
MVDLTDRRGRLSRLWDRFSDYLIVLLVLATLGGIAWGVYNGNVAKENSAAAKTDSQTIIRKDAEIVGLLHQLKAKDTELQAATSEHTQTLAEIATVQQQVANLVKGLQAGSTVTAQIINTALADLKALCNADQASCATFTLPSLPSPPRAAPSATPARPPPTAPVATTTTTRPGKGHHHR